MKKILYLSSLVLITLFFAPSVKANTDLGKTCFTDDGGSTWYIHFVKGDDGTYWAQGQVDVGLGFNWNVWGYGNFNANNGTIELHATNPRHDNCTSYSDSFIYYGNASISHSGDMYSFYGSGSWDSYCFGSILNVGTWATSGPCTSAPVKFNVNGPASHNVMSKGPKKAMNTVCFNDGFYNWKITYTDNGNGNYWATGTVNVEGSNWNVYGMGTFSNHMGPVELHASNPNPDGCFQYTDSFTYYGNAEIMGSGMSTTFDGSGSWISYCYGSEYNYGTWAAAGPCGGALKAQPNGPAKHGNVFSVIVSPNPIKSNGTISYTLAAQSQVNITVYNYMQQPVKVLANGTQSAGKHSYSFDARSSSGSVLPNGLYRVVSIVNGKSYSTPIQIMR